MTKADVKSLCEVNCSGKLPWLQGINISRNILTDCVAELFGGSDNPGFPALKQLHMADTKMIKADVTSLSQAFAKDKLPKLIGLDLSQNTLTDCLKELLRSISKDFTKFFFHSTQLTKADMRSLSCQAINDKKFMRLTWLQLSGNNLNGCVEELLGGSDHSVLTCLKYL